VDDNARDLEREGVRFLPLPMSPDGTSPLQDAALLARYCSLLRKLAPAAFLGFTPKPNVYGSLAARLCGVPSVNNLTGLGTAFIHGSTLERLVSSLYRLSLRNSEAVFFHNPDDRDLFVSRRLVRPDRASVIPGSGVDLELFRPAPFPDNGQGPTFLFVGRLLREKGAGEFAEAARAVKRAYPEARFRMLGGFADGSRAVPRGVVDEWQSDGSIEHLGTCSDVRPHIAAADCVVLPSYREGLPRVLIEAAAMARPAIASDVPGCRHVVVDGVTGFLCASRSSEAVAEAMIRMIRKSSTERESMGRRARAHAEEHFGVERVWTEYLSVLTRIGAGA
jgi:glycosyltransferase involved in cell wall biosynthesis